jgi:hypothetical protein
VGLNRWLRTNAEHYLLVGAQQQVAARYDLTPSFPKHGVKGRLFLMLFVPIYRLLPWRVRLGVLQRLPGSHRQTWSPRPRTPNGPAI